MNFEEGSIWIPEEKKGKLKAPVKLSKLEIGGVIDGDEAIIEVRKVSMDTIRNDVGIESGKNYDMKVFHYDLTTEGKEVTHIKYNGYGEVFLSDENHDEYKSILKGLNLWKEDII